MVTHVVSGQWGASGNPAAPLVTLKVPQIPAPGFYWASCQQPKTSGHVIRACYKALISVRMVHEAWLPQWLPLCLCAECAFGLPDSNSIEYVHLLKKN